MSVGSIYIEVTWLFVTCTGYVLMERALNIVMCISVALMAFSVYTLNKLTDMEEDAINVLEKLKFLQDRKNWCCANFC